MPGLVLYRFNAALIFYNAPYFKRRVLAVAANSPGARWLIVDGAPLVHLDSTGADTIVALVDDLASHGIRLSIGGVLPRVRRMLERGGALEKLGDNAVFPTLRAAVQACESRRAIANPGSDAPRSGLFCRQPAAVRLDDGATDGEPHPQDEVERDLLQLGPVAPHRRKAGMDVEGNAAMAQNRAAVAAGELTP